jgi:hypothetical protein
LRYLDRLLRLDPTHEQGKLLKTYLATKPPDIQADSPPDATPGTP